ncbi:MAG: ABC transporter ATP-binding protein [Pseudomonadales bacterium]|nr:ABC transporter ATP-binding protein [Pseudomonadales bacterium]
MRRTIRKLDVLKNQISEDLVLSCTGIAKSYWQGDVELRVLQDIHLQLARGERIAIIGASGAGKSTLLGVLGLLDAADKGELILCGQNTRGLDDSALSALRNRSLGFVYQFHHLLGEFDAAENVAMPLLIAGEAPDKARATAKHWLQKVGLAERAGHRPSELSGGERQRVAVARALANEPGCVLMDEPTGNLDRAAAQNILSLIDNLSATGDTAFIVVTHDPSVASVMDRSYELRDGILNPVTQSDFVSAAVQQLPIQDPHAG